MHNSKYQCHMAACCTHRRSEHSESKLNNNVGKPMVVFECTVEIDTKKDHGCRTQPLRTLSMWTV